jgi:hypothetical protein
LKLTTLLSTVTAVLGNVERATPRGAGKQMNTCCNEESVYYFLAAAALATGAAPFSFWTTTLNVALTSGCIWADTS